MSLKSQAVIYSVIMPAYHEVAHLQNNVLETMQVMKHLGKPYEIIIVDDGSRDGSDRILRKLGQRYPQQIKPLILSLNEGKGHALRAGFAKTHGSLIFFLDADLDLDPRQFKVLLETMHTQQTDVVIGSKRHPQTVSNYPWKRRVVSAVYFFMVKLLFGLPLKDTQTGIKLFKREVLKLIFPKILVKKYAFDLEVLVLTHHFGYTIAEAPVIVNYKTKFGHIGLEVIFRMAWDTIAIWYRLYWRRYYDTTKRSISKNLST
jgi:glycosyltransferase involved in cell wall biosynthesis